MAIRIAVIGDHPLALQAMSAVLEGNPDVEVVAIDTSKADLLRLIRQTCPNVVLLDFSVKGRGCDPFTTVENLKRAYPIIRILAVICRDDGILIRGLVHTGVAGCLFNDDEQILDLGTVSCRIARGEQVYSQGMLEKYLDHPRFSLLPHEMAILRLAADGLSNSAIAERLMITHKTVRNNLSKVYAKLGTSHRTGMNPRVDAINRARQLGLL
jgi:DNA-binding NarL/FixJ family response regulator